MPDNMTDQAVVTFALFAYNQDEYILEAAEGAFAQTYEPLEMILSDDCSSDGTLEVLQEMAATYDHPAHRILRQIPNMKILITGGAGYIGSHTLVDVLVSYG